LRKLPLAVHHVMCCVFVYQFPRKSFRNVRRLKIRLYHGSLKKKKKGKILAQYQSTKQVQGASLVAALLTRKGAWWSLTCPAAPGGSPNTLNALLQQSAALVHGLVAASPSRAPVFRHVSIVVTGARNLVATDVHVFSKNSADPYYKFQFRKCRYKSEYKKKSLNPRWAPRELGLGYICASDVKPIKIKLWDYDKFTEKDFMGKVKVPAACFFQLGPGRHSIVLPLRTDKKHRHVRVKGSISLTAIVGPDSTMYRPQQAAYRAW